MTVVVAFLCSDGAVVAADSMLTPSVGGVNVGHHHGRKIEILAGPQLFGFAGDLGQAARFKIMADSSHGLISGSSHPLDYALAITRNLLQQFVSTGIQPAAIGVNTVLSYVHIGTHQCCIYEGALQPRLLDVSHYYAALGSGKLSADPFLRFLVDVFCAKGIPKVSEATFLAIWTIQHVIDTNPGGVAGPIRIATFEKDDVGQYAARELPDDDIAEHQQAIESASEALRRWRDELQSGRAADDVPEPPGLAS
jgi:20S proteasome alpha/beta subunit